MTINEIKDFLAEGGDILKRALTYFPRDLIALSRIVRQHFTKPESWLVNQKTLATRTTTRALSVNSNSSLTRMASANLMWPV